MDFKDNIIHNRNTASSVPLQLYVNTPKIHVCYLQNNFSNLFLTYWKETMKNQFRYRYQRFYKIINEDLNIQNEHCFR